MTPPHDFSNLIGFAGVVVAIIGLYVQQRKHHAQNIGTMAEIRLMVQTMWNDYVQRRNG